MQQGILYIVATPIGNLEDITLRALRVLKEVDVVFAEDTRVAKKLLSHYEINTNVERLDANVEKERGGQVVDLLQEGKSVAFISDAGTPGISDPGSRLVQTVREASERIEAIPGASSLSAALSIAGMKSDDFLFLGFLPHKKGRQTALKRIAESVEAVVLFESTHRIEKFLKECIEYFPEKRVIVAKELTKIHEEVLSGTAKEVLQVFSEDPQKHKGEFVVIIEE
jgi:16S rRNA (cytidine1402-2'-O)-methyltransferase